MVVGSDEKIYSRRDGPEQKRIVSVPYQEKLDETAQVRDETKDSDWDTVSHAVLCCCGIKDLRTPRRVSSACTCT